MDENGEDDEDGHVWGDAALRGGVCVEVVVVPQWDS